MAFSQKSDENNFSLFYGSNFSPHFCSRKNRHFGNQFSNFFDSQKDPLNTIGKKNGIFTNKFQKKFRIYIWFINAD